jgi:hypothetical protein
MFWLIWIATVIICVVIVRVILQKELEDDGYILLPDGGQIFWLVFLGLVPIVNVIAYVVCIILIWIDNKFDDSEDFVKWLFRLKDKEE